MKTTLAFLLIAPGLIFAQAGRGRGPAGPPPTGKSQAPIDLTGYWVSQIVDEWRFRVSPVKGDILYVPLNAEARRVANAWDPDKDIADGNQCKAYGAVGVMQRPGRLHISWTDDNTLKVDADAGTQTRVWHLGQASETPGPATLQGYSAAKWEGPGFGRGGRGFGQRPGPPPKTAALHVETTNMLPGYLRKNGVPYSEKTMLNEYVNLVEGRQNDSYIAVTAMVDDPTYLTGPFIRTYTFKKEADGEGWDPTPCWNK